jgi:hypothetical protein
MRVNFVGFRALFNGRLYVRAYNIVPIAAFVEFDVFAEIRRVTEHFSEHFFSTARLQRGRLGVNTSACSRSV